MQNDSFQQRFPYEHIKERGGKRASWQVPLFLLPLFNDSRTFSPMLALLQSCFCKAPWLCSETWSALTGGWVFRTPAGLLFCLLVSVLCGWHSCKWFSQLCLSCLARLHCPEWKHNECQGNRFEHFSEISGAALVPLNGELWMCCTQSSCTVRSRRDLKPAHDVFHDLRPVCSNRISSTQTITFSFPLIVSLFLSSPTILQGLCFVNTLLLMQICRCLRKENMILFNSTC